MEIIFSNLIESMVPSRGCHKVNCYCVDFCDVPRVTKNNVDVYSTTSSGMCLIQFEHLPTML